MSSCLHLLLEEKLVGSQETPRGENSGPWQNQPEGVKFLQGGKVGKLYLASPLEILLDLCRPVAYPGSVLPSTILAFTPMVKVYSQFTHIKIKLGIFFGNLLKGQNSQSNRIEFTCFSLPCRQSNWFEVPFLSCAAAAPSLLAWGELPPPLLLDDILRLGGDLPPHLLLLLGRSGNLCPGKRLASHPAQDLAPQALGPAGISAAGWGV